MKPRPSVPSVTRSEVDPGLPDEGAPRVSFGLPVRNGERFLGRALESILASDFASLEVVVCDNASTDGTRDVATRLAEHDARVRYVRNDEDIGQILNFNRVFELSRGEYFRWIGADDQLHPTYVSRCVEALDAHPGAVGVTTLWRLVDDDGKVDFHRYTGPRVDASDVVARFRTTLHLLRVDRLAFDPIYSMIRRRELLATPLLQIDQWCDRLLALQLCLRGPWTHVDEVLATRREAHEPEAVRVPRFHPLYRGRGVEPLSKLYEGLARVVRAHPLTPSQRARCLAWLRIDHVRREAHLRSRFAARVVARLRGR
ncbi:MAG: glycosyltransferase family 2 protein [Planctomycetes bacterium]|nr:glycosyltransferase family 2 protein [Planctomycetota bacterium]